VKTILRLWQTLYYRWALAEIDLMHPDVPRIVRRLNELEAST
jgi:hypothetical protein